MGDELSSSGKRVSLVELSKMSSTGWHNGSQEMRNDYIIQAERRKVEFKRKGKKAKKEKGGLKWVISTPKQPRNFKIYNAEKFDNEIFNNESKMCEIQVNGKNDTILFVNYFKTAMANKINKPKDVTVENTNILKNPQMFYENYDYGIPLWFSPRLLEPSKFEIIEDN